MFYLVVIGNELPRLCISPLPSHAAPGYDVGIGHIRGASYRGNVGWTGVPVIAAVGGSVAVGEGPA